MMQETEETGAKTMEMLDEQGEQLNRIEEGIVFSKKYNILKYFKGSSDLKLFYI